MEVHGDRAEVYTGGTTVVIFFGSRRHGPEERVVEALRPVAGRGGVGASLPPPALPRDLLADLRRLRRLLDRTGSVEAVHRRLGISRSAVRDRARLERVLRRFARVRPTPRRSS